MTRILLLNPNTTGSVTTLMAEAATPVAAAGTSIVPLTAPRGFPYVATRAEAQIASAVVLEMLAEAPDADAVIIAAFGDPGLLGARELLNVPVVGVSEAAMLTACMLGQRFALVTFTAALKPWFHDCVALHGLGSRCAGILALHEAPPPLATVQETLSAQLIDLAGRAVTETGADVLIFAGAPLAGLASKVADNLPVPVIDPVAAAVKQAEALVALQPRKATAGSFARPPGKPSRGLSPPLAALMGSAPDGA